MISARPLEHAGASCDVAGCRPARYACRGGTTRTGAATRPRTPGGRSAGWAIDGVEDYKARVGFGWDEEKQQRATAGREEGRRWRGGQVVAGDV